MFNRKKKTNIKEELIIPAVLNRGRIVNFDKLQINNFFEILCNIDNQIRYYIEKADEISEEFEKVDRSSTSDDKAKKFNELSSRIEILGQEVLYYKSKLEEIKQSELTNNLVINFPEEMTNEESDIYYRADL